jgi:hypothetical protein
MSWFFNKTNLHSLFISGNCLTLHLVGYILEYKFCVVFFVVPDTVFTSFYRQRGHSVGRSRPHWLITTAACIIFLYSNVLSSVDILYSLVCDKTRSCSSANVIVRPLFGGVSVLGRVHFR